MNDVFGKKLGQYILLEQLGEGGMAKVYNALDSRMEGNVAIKIILPSKRTSSAFLQQFEREAKALANLTHTNIVKVLNYGIQDGQPYLVMEYVSGGTLREAMRQKMPWQTAAAVLAPIARALDYVHRQQIVHRDVKPSNILLHEDFRPMLSDFGILKLLEDKEEKVDSAIGAGIGTPEYMPPEQGLGKEVDFRADIYSLGLVFYEMVTGQKPFTADSPMAIVIKHVTDALPLPTKIDKNIPKYVERVILRAVQKNPKNRYISMGHFADALELIALGDKASPQKINRVSREKEKRQRSVSILSLSILLLMVLLGTSIFAYNYFRGTQLANIPSATPLVAVEETPTQNSPPTQISTSLPAEAPILNPGIDQSTLTLLGTPIPSNQNSQFNEVAHWGIGGVNIVRWSPDGKTIALGTTSGIFLYDSQTKELTLFIDTQFNVLDMSFNPLGHEITAGSPTGVVKTWNYETGEFLQNFSFNPSTVSLFATSGEVTAISYSPDGKNIAVGYKNGVINYFPSTQGDHPKVLDNFPSVEDLVISYDSHYIYTSNGSNDINVWDINTQTKTILSNPGSVSNLSMSTDRQLMLAGGNGNSVYLWLVGSSNNEAKQIIGFSNLGGRTTDFDFSHDNKYVAIALSDGGVKVFETPGENETKTLQPVSSFNDFIGQILSVTFSPNGPIVASANHGEGLRLRNVETNEEEPFPLDKVMGGVDEIFFSSDGLWLATSHAGGLMRIWNVNEAKEAHPPFEGYLPKGAPFSPDNNFLAYIYSPGKNKGDVIRIVELKTGNIVAELPGYLQKSFVQFRGDSKLLAMSDFYQASIWDVATWEQVDTGGNPSAGCGQYFTPQNNLLAIVSNAGILFTNNKVDPKIVAMCSTKPQGAILAYYFYEEHQMLFIVKDGNVLPWDFGPSERLRRDFEFDIPYFRSSETFLAGDQESGWYAYAYDKNIYIKNLNGAAGATIESQDDFPYRVALLPGKNLMALGSKYGSIHIWTMP